MFVDPLPADRPHVTVGLQAFAADPRPDAHGDYNNSTGTDRDHE